MFKDIARLSRQTIIYGMGHMLTKVVSFLLLPFLTHQLPPSEFAVFILFGMAISVVIEFLRLGLDVSLLRDYVLEKELQQRKVIFSTIFYTALAFSTLIAILLWSMPETWLRLIISAPEGGHPEWMVYTLRLCAGVIWLDNLSAFPLMVIRGESRAVRFASIKITGSVAQVGLTVILLAVFHRGVAGAYEANLLSSVLMMLMTLPTILKRMRPVFNWSVFTAAAAFGLPNVPNALFYQVVELADRKILELLRTDFEVGVYSAAYKLGMALSIVAMAFRFAWQPFFLQLSERPDAKQIYARVLTYYTAGAGWLFLLLTAIVEPLVKWDIPGMGPLIDPAYWSGLGVFPIVLLAHLPSGIIGIFMVGVYLKKKTWFLPIVTGIAAVVNVAGNILLIPRWGMWAAAWLTLVSYAIMPVILHFYINRHYPVKWEWSRMLHLSIVGALVFAIGAVGRQHGWQLPGFVAALAFPALLLATGAANQTERARLARLWRRNKGGQNKSES